MPNEQAKGAFYSQIMQDWFSVNAFNAKNLNVPLIKQTFMEGGYYRVNLPTGNLTVLVMNSVAFSIKNDPTQ